ncbi:Calx-beta domain-containing protein [Leifsonia aquatica]|uniref:Calx-beta domain-containing protein n=1 Tax=Leifsonia aquatica TaxID=144185 RepID=UPI0009DD9274|nr:Calx-beta domain-containing protein [Leifsonia aquatica]
MTRSSAHLRVACAVGIAALAGLLGAAPAALAQPTPVPVDSGVVTPFVDCVQDAPLGAVTARTVVLGYRSTAAAPLTLPAGAGDNDLTSGPADRGQPSTFLPGEHHGVTLLTVDAQAEPSLGWRVRDAIATIAPSAPSCTDATAVTVSAPTSTEAGRSFVVTAAVTRLLLGTVDAGAVGFSVDGGAETVVPIAAGSARAELTAPAAGSHTLVARYLPADGATVRPASASTALSTVAVSGPLSVAANSVVAGSTSAVLVVTRAAGTGEATVDYATADGTATAGIDYTATSGTVVLADGVRQATIRIPIPARAPGASAATFFVLLQRASTSVGSASAAVLLPPVPVTTPASAGDGIGPTGALTAAGSRHDTAGPASALPLADPTAAGERGTGQDLLLLIVGAILTVGGIAGVISVVRGVTLSHASS